MRQGRSGLRYMAVGLGSMAAGAACLLATIPGQAGAQDPPGNNGTVKIDGEEFDSHPDNQPHVGCVFQVDWYGFDEGDFFSDVTFESHPPTGPVVTLLTDTVFIGGDDNSGGGSEDGLDASETYTLDLSGIEPHPNQGWHVKLTVNNDGSQGADVKHKVFWVTECAPPPTTSTTSTSTTSTSTTSTSSTSSTSSTVPETTTTTVGGSTTTVGGVSPTTVPGQLPRTGSTTGPMVGIGAALLAGGAALVGFARRLGHS